MSESVESAIAHLKRERDASRKQADALANAIAGAECVLQDFVQVRDCTLRTEKVGSCIFCAALADYRKGGQG